VATARLAIRSRASRNVSLVRRERGVSSAQRGVGTGCDADRLAHHDRSLGFVTGTALTAALNIADIVPSRTLFAASALSGAAVNAGIIFAGGFHTALVLRFLHRPLSRGSVSAGNEDDRDMVSGAARSRNRNSGGSAHDRQSDTVSRSRSTGAGVRPVVLTASTGAVVAALLVAFGYREGPYPFAARPFSWKLVADVARVRDWRLATGGYLGHMFELYAFWTWIPAFLAASAAASAAASRPTTASCH
jgi:hypothetical protein